MRREDIEAAVGRFRAEDVAKIMLILRAGFGISVEYFFRFENECVVLRGREGGTNDDGRLFFIPYEEIVYLKLDRPVHPNELRRMYGESVLDGDEDYSEESEETTAPGSSHSAPAAPAAVPVSTPMTPGDIARQNLLERIRAARTVATSRNGR